MVEFPAVTDQSVTIHNNLSQEDPNGEKKKSYTNTINSEEFRQYLKKRGLMLFPAKVKTAPEAPKETENITEANK